MNNKIKKIRHKITLLIFMIASSMAFSQMTSDFKNLMLGFNQLTDISSVGSYEMLQNKDFLIDKELAWKYLTNQNEFIKVENANYCPIGWYKLNDKIAVIFFFQANPEDEIHTINAITINYTKDKVIDQLNLIGAFTKDGDKTVCKLQVNTNAHFVLTTINFKESVIDFSVKNNGKFELKE